MIHDPANREDRTDGSQPTEPLSYWRTFRVEEFDIGMTDAVAACVATITSTIPEWRAAVSGNAAAAIGLVLPCRAPEVITFKVDLPMTTLLNVAFHNPAAALVLSHKLRQMPLDSHLRSRLATSWLVHNLWLGHRENPRRRSGSRWSGEK